MTRPICGGALREHGAIPDNVKFRMEAGLNYVSCSPYSVAHRPLAVPRPSSQALSPIAYVDMGCPEGRSPSRQPLLALPFLRSGGEAATMKVSNAAPSAFGQLVMAFRKRWGAVHGNGSAL
jgi:pyruvate,orthophosphate dikinase